MPKPTIATRRSIVVVVAVLMAVLVLLAVTGMIGSMVIAQINRGMATAVNQSGTLRMQSYRVGVALADERLPVAERQRRARALADEYEQRLTSPRLTDALPHAANDPVRLAYERVRWRWVHEMRRAVARFVDADDAAGVAAGLAAYLDQVDDFVADIHGLVRVLEDRAERHIELLRWMQGVALMLTLAVVLLTLVIVQRRVVAPLGDLLRCADRARRGDFSARTRFTDADELGRLGAALNLMTEGLSQIYNELEERVAEKTSDLARTNRSLQLLYRTSRTLDEAPLSEPLLRRVLEDVRAQLHLEQVMLCLRDEPGIVDGECIGTGDACKPRGACGDAPCEHCEGPWMPGADSAPPGLPGDAGRTFDVPVGDTGRCLGKLRVRLHPDQRLEPWQRPLLESVAGHVAAALELRARMREGRRLILHEERSILARELHDSLAQSLSYLKIQAARLEMILKRPQPADGSEAEAATGASGRVQPTPEAILAELRTGIGSAYRQLRELLTTFRLRMDGAGLGSALAATVRELEGRGGLAIALDDRLPPGLLSPNEEVHVLQIVREALSNVARHARATRCRVGLLIEGEQVQVSVIDDGAGILSQDDAAAPRHTHYGMIIMTERAESLGGAVEVGAGPEGGTAMRLRFRPRRFARAGAADASRSSARPGIPEDA